MALVGACRQVRAHTWSITERSQHNGPEEVSATVRGLIGWYDTVQRSPPTPSARPQIDVDCVDGGTSVPLRRQ